MKKFFYRVKKEDNLFSLCDKFNLCPFKLISDNNLTCEIQDGDLLYIEQFQSSLYKVKPFESLESLSKKFNVSMDELKKINGNLPFVYYGLNIYVGGNC